MCWRDGGLVGQQYRDITLAISLTDIWRGGRNRWHVFSVCAWGGAEVLLQLPTKRHEEFVVCGSSPTRDK